MHFQIELENFQGFKDKQTIPLRPLTLVFGPNSSGKSSIIRSILLTAQTAPNWNQIRWVGKLVDLSSFQNTVFGHDVKSMVSIGYKVGFVRALRGTKGTFDLHQTHVKISVGRTSRPSSFTYQFRLEDGASVSLAFTRREDGETWQLSKEGSKNIAKLAQSLINFLSPPKKRKVATSQVHKNTQWSLGWRSAFYSLEDQGYMNALDNQNITRYLNELDLPLDAMGTYYLPEDSVFRKRFPYVVLGRLLKEIMAEVNSRFSSVRHVGPSRVVTSSIEPAGKPDSEYLSSDGANLLQTLDADRVQRLNIWLSKVTEGQYSAKIQKMPNALLGELRTLILRDNHTKSDVQLKDVGSGLSQIIPVLQNLSMSQGKSPLILLQQPELHLHPKMQAHLADLLVQETASTKNSKQRNQPIVVLETHSENLILRVQKLIRTGLLDSNDVAVLFVDRVSADKTGPRSSKKGNQVQVLDLDKYGEFKTDWPLSFSELRLDEIF